MTMCGFLEIAASRIVIDDDFDGVVILESLHVDKEIRFRSRGDIARPVLTHLVPRIKVQIRKLTGHSFASLYWVEEQQDLAVLEELGAVIRL
jgi:hypothetical protein